MAVALLAGCTRTILGAGQPVAPGAELAPIRVADLLIEPGQFPARYPAVVLDARAVYRALQDVDGVAAASVVNPPQCAPPPRTPQDTAAAQGVDSQDATSAMAVISRPQIRATAGLTKVVTTTSRHPSTAMTRISSPSAQSGRDRK